VQLENSVSQGSVATDSLEVYCIPRFSAVYLRINAEIVICRSYKIGRIVVDHSICMTLVKYVGPVSTCYAAVRLVLRNPNSDL